MKNPLRFASVGCAISAIALASPVMAATESVESFELEAAASETTSEEETQAQPQGQAQGRPPAQQGAGDGQPPIAFPNFKPVFDDTWATVGIGAGLVPSYSGSDDYIVFPLPLIVGRVGGVGISPNGPGFALNVLSPEPSLGNRKTRVQAGPNFRIRNDRVNQIQDDVVELAEDLDLAVEVGGNVGVSIPGVFNPRDTVTLSTQVSWDIAGAHEGMLIEPSIGYTRFFGTGVRVSVNANMQFVDDDFAEYYYTVNAAQAAATGLPLFDADGGLNSVGTLAIINVDLDGNALNGGLGIYTILGYSRLVGDGADTPFTDLRGDPNQFIGGLGIGYTF